MAETSFEELPQDLQTKILSQMSLKSLGRCICTAKKLASIIRTKDFRDLFLLRSKTNPRVLLISEFRGNALLHSVYEDETKPLFSSGQETMRISLERDNEISEPIRGLVCIRQQTNFAICNLGTKKITTLSKIQVPKGDFISVKRTHFGYDQDSDVFKVLCVTKLISNGQQERAHEYQILTVRSSTDQESWRKIQCEDYPNHTPITYQGLCKEGVLYYGAKSITDESLIVSFNVSSEKFTFTKLPKEVDIDYRRWGLVNYYKEIALVNDQDFYKGISDSNGNGVFKIWVRNGFSGDWKSESIVVYGWSEAVGNICKKFFFKGTIRRTGELFFAQDHFFSHRSFFVLYYDTVTKHFRKVEIEGVFKGHYFVRTILDHLDTPQFM